MPRPKKKRCIYEDPGKRYFKPRGIPLINLEIIKLNLEEYEALRLKDLEEMDQLSAAKEMKISRGTFQRILKSGRRKISKALVFNCAIELEGGEVVITNKEDEN